MPILELSTYFDQKAAQPLPDAGDHAGVAGERLPHQSLLLSLSQNVVLTCFGQFVHNVWMHVFSYLLWRCA